LGSRKFMKENEHLGYPYSHRVCVNHTMVFQRYKSLPGSRYFIYGLMKMHVTGFLIFIFRVNKHQFTLFFGSINQISVLCCPHGSLEFTPSAGIAGYQSATATSMLTSQTSISPLSRSARLASFGTNERWGMNRKMIRGKVSIKYS
jgi:hypothetical protein